MTYDAGVTPPRAIGASEGKAGLAVAGLAAGALALAAGAAWSGIPAMMVPAFLAGYAAWSRAPRPLEHALDVPAFDAPPGKDPARARAERVLGLDGVYLLGRMSGRREAWASTDRMRDGLAVFGGARGRRSYVEGLALQHLALGGGLTWIAADPERDLVARVTDLAGRVGRTGDVTVPDPHDAGSVGRVLGIDALDHRMVSRVLRRHCLGPAIAGDGADAKVRLGTLLDYLLALAADPERPTPKREDPDMTSHAALRRVMERFPRAEGLGEAARHYVDALQFPQGDPGTLTHAGNVQKLRAIVPAVVEPLMGIDVVPLLGQPPAEAGKGPVAPRPRGGSPVGGRRILACPGLHRSGTGMPSAVAALVAEVAAGHGARDPSVSPPHMLVVDDALHCNPWLLDDVLGVPGLCVVLGCPPTLPREGETAGVRARLDALPTRVHLRDARHRVGGGGLARWWPGRTDEAGPEAALLVAEGRDGTVGGLLRQGRPGPWRAGSPATPARVALRQPAPSGKVTEKEGPAAGTEPDTPVTAPAWRSVVVVPEHYRPAVGGANSRSSADAEAKRYAELAGKGLLFRKTGDLHALREGLDRAFPHLAGVTERLVNELAATPYATWRPFLLCGPPGAGKSRYARAIGKAMGLHTVVYPCGGQSDGAIGGTSRQWSTGRPCVPLQAVGGSHCANPLLVLDEVEKAGTGRHNGNLVDTLHGLLDRETARAYLDPLLEVPVDLSGVCWIGTANSTDGLPQALLDRFRLVTVDEPGVEHAGALVRAMASDIAEERGLGAEWAVDWSDDEVDMLAEAWGGGSLRRLRSLVAKATDRVEAAGAGVFH